MTNQDLISLLDQGNTGNEILQILESLSTDSFVSDVVGDEQTQF